MQDKLITSYLVKKIFKFLLNVYQHLVKIWNTKYGLISLINLSKTDETFYAK